MTVFIERGDAPMSYRQAVKRGLRHFEAEKAYWQREQGIVESDPAYLAWAAQWVADNAVNEANNLFNHRLAAYRAAQARLARYRLVDGRPEVTEQQQAINEHGQPVLDGETGEPVMETVVVHAAIEQLPAEIEQPVYDEATGEQSGTEMVPNPEIVRDDAERAAAQEVIDGTPQEVADFENQT